MEPRTKKLLIGVAIGLLLTVVIVVFLIFYSRNAPPTSHFPIIVAVVALVGTLWTGAITLTGLLLKDSVDQRNGALQAESEKRLRMETALKAIELISRAEVEGAPIRETREAAILVMASLDQVSLALSMAYRFLAADKVSVDALIGVVDQSLKSPHPELHEEAAYVLRLSAQWLPVGRNRLAFPAPHMTGWTGKLANSTKEHLLLALLTALLSKEFDYWERSVLNWALYALYVVFTHEQERRFKYFGAVFAKELCDLTEEFPGDAIMPPDRHILPYGEIRSEAIAAMAELGTEEGNMGEDDYALLLKIRGWKKTPPPVPQVAEDQ